MSKYVSDDEILIAQWHQVRNGLEEIDPSKTPVISQQAVWWRCTGRSKHEWIEPVRERYEGRDRPCSHCVMKVKDEAREAIPIDVKAKDTLHKKAPEVAKRWHRRKNKELTPKHMKVTSKEKAWWQCGLWVDHVWEQSINEAVILGAECPYCREHEQILDR